MIGETKSAITPHQDVQCPEEWKYQVWNSFMFRQKKNTHFQSESFSIDLILSGMFSIADTVKKGAWQIQQLE